MTIKSWFAMAAALVAGHAAQAWPQDPAGLSDADRIAVFEAADATRHGDKWVVCGDDPAPAGAEIAEVRDLNGDGHPEAVVTEGGTFCYGFTGTGFQLLGKQADGSWRRITADIGIPQFLDSTGTDGWPDISIGGPGFCFPVQRWNGTEYALDRHEYEGKACNPDR